MFETELVVALVSVLASYFFCAWLVRVLVEANAAERRKNEMLIDAIQAKNLTERARKRVVDRNMDIIERTVNKPKPKQDNLPGLGEDSPPPGFVE